MILKGEGSNGEVTSREMYEFLSENLNPEPVQMICKRFSQTRVQALSDTTDEHRISALLTVKEPKGRLFASRLGRCLMGGGRSFMTLQIEDLRDPDKGLYLELSPANPDGQLHLITGDPDDVNSGEVREPQLRDTAAINYAFLGLVERNFLR